jgi:hypothetical protein
MAFLRFTRDKRGYEHFYLVQPLQRRGKTTARVLYWFRTPPNVKVGREPFDEDVRRALEAQNPDVTFDWRKILDTPIPSADAEKWRERRRADRAVRAARRAETTTASREAAAEEPPYEEPSSEESTSAETVSTAAGEAALGDETFAEEDEVTEGSDLPADASSNGDDVQPMAAATIAEPNADLRVVGSRASSHRKRRRRRRRPGRSGPADPGSAPPVSSGSDV